MKVLLNFIAIPLLPPSEVVDNNLSEVSIDITKEYLEMSKYRVPQINDSISSEAISKLASTLFDEESLDLLYSRSWSIYIIEWTYVNNNIALNIILNGN